MFKFGDRVTWVDKSFPQKGALKAIVTQMYGGLYSLVVLDDKWPITDGFASYTPGRSVMSIELTMGWDNTNAEA